MVIPLPFMFKECEKCCALNESCAGDGSEQQGGKKCIPQDKVVAILTFFIIQCGGSSIERVPGLVFFFLLASWVFLGGSMVVVVVVTCTFWCSGRSEVERQEKNKKRKRKEEAEEQKGRKEHKVARGKG